MFLDVVHKDEEMVIANHAIAILIWFLGSSVNKIQHKSQCTLLDILPSGADCYLEVSTSQSSNKPLLCLPLNALEVKKLSSSDQCLVKKRHLCDPIVKK